MRQKLKEKTRAIIQKYGIYPLILIGLWALVTAKSIPAGCVYGSNTDWLSQHAALAETIRDACLEQKTLLPFFLPLGGGSNGYQFSYYGYLRPDILLGCLLPKISMSTILIGYMLAGYLVSVLLFYCWLTEEGKSKPAAFWGSILFLLASCFFHTHRQVMFINYMPFLLAAFCTIQKKQYRRTVIFLVLVYCNSFYYAVSVLAAIGWYWYEKEGRAFFKKYVVTGVLSCGIAAVLLVPSLLAILENRRAVTGVADVSWFCTKMNSLLYKPYGMGLTAVCLYLLLCGVMRKEYRKSSLFYLAVCFFGAVSWILNGTLYVRAKILIPFVPLVVRQCCFVFSDLMHNRKKIPFSPFVVLALCLFSNRKAECFSLLVLDVGLLLFWAVVSRFLEKKVPVILSCTVLFVVPVFSFLQNAKTESWVSREQLAAQEQDFDVNFPQNPLYRSEILTTPLDASNVDLEETGRTSMYSSVTNPDYARFYYDTLFTPVQINNRVALLAEENPFLFQLMGVRYLKTTKAKIPLGFQKVEEKGGIVLAENPNVLPMGYLVTDWISEKAFEQLSETEQLQTLMETTVVNHTPVPELETKLKKELKTKVETKTDALMKTEVNTDANVNTGMRTSIQALDKLREIFPEYSIQKISKSLKINPLPAGGCEIIADAPAELILKMQHPQQKEAPSDLLLLAFDVENKTRQAVVITINDIKNKLSGSGAPYPNQNHRFHYQISKEEAESELKITFSRGHYRLKNVKIYTCGKELLVQKQYLPVQPVETVKNEIFACVAKTDKKSCFATSIPYSRGMKLWVDGKKAAPVVVNTAFAGAFLPAGTHKITITFTPPGYWLGFGCSMGSIFLFSLFCIDKYRKRFHS